MKFIYKEIGLISILFIVASCSFSKKQTMNKAEANDSCKIEVVVLDPGHFHASLLQKDALAVINDTIRIYAPEGIGVNQYLESIDSYNHRTESPTTWKKQVYTGEDYLQKMLSDHKGDVVILAGNNQKKTRYIIESIKAGYNVLADKPLAINSQDFQLLTEAYQLAQQKGLLLYDLMTERYDILNIIEKELLHQTELFGELQKGSPDNPSVIMESVHHFFKKVSGKPLVRPAWYYDIAQQGEGIADVTTHLIDLINWQCFPDEAIHYQSDVKVLSAKHWPTPITLAEFSQSTQTDSFPIYLKQYIKNDVLKVMANGSLNYTVKGICMGMKVTWNYMPPVHGGDTFTSIKKGSKATLKIVQNEKNGFVKELYIQKKPNIDSHTFETQLQKTIEQLQESYPFLSVKNKSNGIYLIDIPQEYRLGHEEHFSKVAKAFLHYIRNKNIPEWENANDHQGRRRGNAEYFGFCRICRACSAADGFYEKAGYGKSGCA